MGLTIASPDTARMVRGWNVSQIPSLSDHNYIKYSLPLRSSAEKFKKWRRADWDTYTTLLEAAELTYADDITSRDELDEAAKETRKIITESLDAACPVRWRRQRGSSQPWWNSHLLELRKKVRASYKQARESSEVNSNQAWNVYREAHRDYRKEIRRRKSESWKNYCSQLEELDPTARLVKTLKLNKADPEGYSSIKLPDGSFTTTASELLAALVDYHVPAVSREERRTEPTRTYQPVDAENICAEWRMKAAVELFHQNKAPGMDGVFSSALKKGWKQLSGPLTKLAQASMKLAHIPGSWAQARGVFIPKTGRIDLTNPKA